MIARIFPEMCHALNWVCKNKSTIERHNRAINECLMKDGSVVRLMSSSDNLTKLRGYPWHKIYVHRCAEYRTIPGLTAGRIHQLGIGTDLIEIVP